MNIQYLTDDTGTKTHVVLPVDEFESLLDNLAFDEAISNQDEVLPDHLVEALLNGKSKLKAWRQYRQLTQQALGDMAGVSKEYISMLESGKRKGNIDTIKILAGNLKIDVDDLI